MAGKTIQIYEHLVTLPPLPTKRENILFINDKKQDAVWRRIEYPDLFYDYTPKTRVWQQHTVYDQDGQLISLSEDDSNLLRRLLIADLHHRTYGVYANIGGEIVWIAPDYYFCLQWCKMKDLPKQYGDFRFIQNDSMILWDYAKKNEDILGLIIAKAKKTGITQIFASAFLNEATMGLGYEMGIASKEHTHAKTVAMAYLFHSYDNIPQIIRPREIGRNLHEIKFGDNSNFTAKGKSGRLNTKGTVAESRVFAPPTKANCFDGPVMRRGLIDEFPKWYESSSVRPEAAFNKMSETVKMQQRINGKLAFISYLPEVDDFGFRDYKSLWKKSQLSTMTALTNRTESQMIAMPILGTESNDQCFDKYGRCDKIKAFHLITSERDSKTSIADRQAHMRQYPTCTNDMFDSGGRGTTFNNIRLGERLHDLEELQNTGHPPGRPARLRWSNPLWEDCSRAQGRPVGKFCPVMIEYLTDDEIMRGVSPEFIIYHDLPEEYLNRAVRSKRRHPDDGALCPFESASTGFRIGAIDPTDYVKSSDVEEGSKNAMGGMMLYDPAIDTRLRKPVTNTLLFDYVYRHEDPDDDMESFIKAMILWDLRVVVESNKKWAVTTLIKEGLHWFCLLFQRGLLEPYKEGDENKLVTTTQNMIDAYCRAISRYIAPVKAEGDTDYLHLLGSALGIQQLMDFDPGDTKRFDWVVMLGYLRLAVESFAMWLEDNQDDVNSEGIGSALLQLVHF